ncbi:MAG: FtsX-like permease family protein [Proteobacteria bacterium]|nr:FtsX-like permease family protein [Pseudomonadota bacterium]
MEIGPIFKALMRNKVRLVLISMEIAITLAIITNCVAYVADFRRSYMIPSGLDEENLLAVEVEPYGAAFNKNEAIDALREDDLRRLNSFPAVRLAAGIAYFPLGGLGNIVGYRKMGSKKEYVHVPITSTTDGILESLGIELIRGRNFNAKDFAANKNADNQRHQSVIITERLAKALFRGSDALGQTLESHRGIATIVGITGPVLHFWPFTLANGGGYPDSEYLMFIAGHPGDEDGINYVVRAEPGEASSLIAPLEEMLLNSNDQRGVKVMPYADIRARSFDAVGVLVSMMLGIIILLISITLLAILGITAYSVTERTNQIGTRRALGATRFQVARYFLVESGLISAIGLIIGVIGAVSLNYFLGTTMELPQLSLPLVAGNVVILWAASLLAALVPALRAASVSPVLATKV